MVEDDLDFSGSAKFLFSDHQFKAVTNVQDAVSEILNDKPDLIFADWRLGEGTNSLKVIEMAMGQKIQIVVQTATPEDLRFLKGKVKIFDKRGHYADEVDKFLIGLVGKGKRERK